MGDLKLHIIDKSDNGKKNIMKNDQEEKIL